MTLDALLGAIGLDAHYATFVDEELTELETLTWMAKDSDSDFLSSMEELGLSADDAQRLMRALLDADECTSEEPAESPAAPPVPAPAPAMPMPAVG